MKDKKTFDKGFWYPKYPYTTCYTRWSKGNAIDVDLYPPKGNGLQTTSMTCCVHYGIPYTHNLQRIVRSFTAFCIDSQCERPTSRIKCQIVAKVELIEVRLFLKRALFIAFYITHMSEIIHSFYRLLSYDSRLIDTLHVYKSRMKEYVWGHLPTRNIIDPILHLQKESSKKCEK